MDFPEEIIEEILCNLPIKSLLRFKCVSKQWHSLFSSKSFIKRHLKKSSTDLSHHRLFILNRVDDFINRSLRSCSLSSLLENSTAVSSDRHPTDHIYDRISEDADADGNYFHRYYSPYCRYPEMMTSTTIGDDGNPNNDGFGILGSCNGLTLVTIGMRDLFMWNPTTRQDKKIVPPESHCFTDAFKNIRRRSFLYGLGYVESTDEYKIVCIFFSYMNHRPTATEIYSSRAGSWKKIQNFDNEFTFNGNKKFISGKFVNGKLHWLIKHNNGGKWDIVALDLSEEKYEIVGRPQNFPDRTHHPTQLQALGGYLSFTSSYEVNSRVTDVWVMTKYGETGSWIRAWTLYSEMARGITCMLWLRLTTAENRDSIILVSYGPDAVVYNGFGVLHKSRVDMVDSSTPKYNVDIDANIYVESLVSPFF